MLERVFRERYVIANFENIGHASPYMSDQDREDFATYVVRILYMADVPKALLDRVWDREIGPDKEEVL